MSAELFFGLSRPGVVGSHGEFWRPLDLNAIPLFPACLAVVDTAGRRQVWNSSSMQKQPKLVFIIAEPGAETKCRLEVTIVAYLAAFRRKW